MLGRLKLIKIWFLLEVKRRVYNWHGSHLVELSNPQGMSDSHKGTLLPYKKVFKFKDLEDRPVQNQKSFKNESQLHTHMLLPALSSNGAWSKEPGPTCHEQGILRKLQLNGKKMRGSFFWGGGGVSFSLSLTGEQRNCISLAYLIFVFLTGNAISNPSPPFFLVEGDLYTFFVSACVWGGGGGCGRRVT